MDGLRTLTTVLFQRFGSTYPISIDIEKTLTAVNICRDTHYFTNAENIETPSGQNTLRQPPPPDKTPSLFCMGRTNPPPPPS